MKNEKLIKVGYLISYDYEFIFTSLDCVYEHADLIVLCYDKDFKTWAGNTFIIPDFFFERVKKYDIDNKIQFYADVFYLEEYAGQPMSLDTRQRNMLGKFMKDGGWHIQIDVDEYPYDFKNYVKYLKKISFLLDTPQKKPIVICAVWITMYKKDKGGYYIIYPFIEKFPFATNVPNYTSARHVDGIYIHTPFYCIHQSWAREDDEIKKKILNWSHKNDFDTNLYYHNWVALNQNNYSDYKNIHPLDPKVWEGINYVKAANINDLISEVQEKYPQKSAVFSILKNKIDKKHKLFLFITKLKAFFN